MTLSPIVFVHGILGWGPEEGGFGPYWGDLAALRNQLAQEGIQREIYEASVGPISSYWDRAHELFYQLTGAKEFQYGESYSQLNPLRGRNGVKKRDTIYLSEKPKLCGEKKFPLANMENLHWCSNRPLHFVGHSMGCMTILVMQYLLEKGVFGQLEPCDCEPEQNRVPAANWIKSVSCISGVLNGTTALYASLGYDPNQGVPSSHDHLLRIAGIYPPNPTMWLDLVRSPLTSKELLYDLLVAVEPCYGWDLEQWELTRHKSFLPLLQETNLEFLARINQHPFLYDRDHALANLTIHGAALWNQRLSFCDETLYLSFPTRQATEDQHPLIRRFGLEMERYQGLESLLAGIDAYLATRVESWQGSLGWPMNFRSPSAWLENDGLVPVISQFFPWLGCRQTPDFQIHHQDQPLHKLKAKTWHVFPHKLSGLDHLDVIGLSNPQATEKRRTQFYRQLLAQLP